MLCPSCSHPDSKVVDSRASGDGIRRRRVCQDCGFRFTTHERVDRKLPLVVKKDGSRVPFDRDKVLDGLWLACRKRPVSAKQLEAAADRVEQAAIDRVGGEVPSMELGALVLAELRELDLVGYLRFASVYQDVASASEFIELLQPWIGEKQ